MSVYSVFHENGTQTWHKDGKLHRDDDLPAVIYDSDYQLWYKEDRLHRDNDLPAVKNYDGTQMWYKEGKLHRDNDLPAYISNKTVVWYTNDIKIKEMSREKYDKLLRIYPAIQLYRKKSAVKTSSIYKKWNKSKILEPLLTGMIVAYM